MDKSTLSNYGWVVIAVLVLSVMIALATPFGRYIATAVENTTEGLFDVQQKALDSAGIEIMGQEFEDILNSGGYGNSEYDHNAPELHPSGTIPEGAYYINFYNGTFYTEMPETVTDGDFYIYGDYIYLYSLEECNGWRVMIFTDELKNEIKSMVGEFGAEITDYNKASYGPILESINNEPITDMAMTFVGCPLTIAPIIPNNVTNMQGTFSQCTSLTIAPAIPSSVTDMTDTFRNCTNLTVAPDMSNATSVTDMTRTFWECTSLTTAPVIPGSVTNMHNTFYNCKSLETAPVIPSSVSNISGTFDNCRALVGTITINAINITEYDYCLRFTSITEILGDCTIKDQILATK